MSKDDYFKNMANIALGDVEISGKDGARLRHQIESALRQVERDARHTACEHLNACQQAIQNQSYPAPR